MDLETVKKMKDDWWLDYLRRNTVFDVDGIKKHKEWLIQEVERLGNRNEALKERYAKMCEENDTHTIKVERGNQELKDFIEWAVDISLDKRIVEQGNKLLKRISS